jgi:hypothetical protein
MSQTRFDSYSPYHCLCATLAVAYASSTSACVHAWMERHKLRLKKQTLETRKSRFSRLKG